MNKTLNVYVDGSHIKGTKKLGFGAWGILTQAETTDTTGTTVGVKALQASRTFTLSGTEETPLFKKLGRKFPGTAFSNPTMELFGLFVTLSKCIEVPNLDVTVYQDYSGAVNFGYLWSISAGKPRAPKAWNAKEPYIIYLVECIEVMCKCIIENGGSVKIQWVPAHQTDGIHASGNNKADMLAKSRKEEFISPFIVDEENE